MNATNGSEKSRLDAADLPQGFADTAALDDFLAMPTEALCADLASIDGDIMILGAGGKMGPSLARLAFNAAPDKKIYCVARFSDEGARRQIEESGIEAIACDLLDRDAIQKLPERRGLKKHLESKTVMANYNDYLRWRNLVPQEVASRPEKQHIRLSALWRERKQLLGLWGVKCRRCGTPQYEAKEYHKSLEVSP